MVKSITLEKLYKAMVSTQHIVEKEDSDHITVDGIRFANADGRRVSPLSFGNFGVYPQCLDAFHYWLSLALLADCMLNGSVLCDVSGKFGMGGVMR